MTVGVRRRLLLLLSLGVLAGCSDGARVSTPAGYTTRTVRDPNFSIALPRSWPSFDPRSKHRDSPLTLIAVAPGRAGTFRTSLNVIQTRVPGSLSFEQLSRHEAEQVRLATHAKDIRQDETGLRGGRALRLRYRARSNAVVHQYFVRHGDFLYVLTYTTAPTAAARYAKIFDVSAHTFQLR